MSLLTGISAGLSVASQASSLFGGGGNGGPNLARSFSKRCGLSPPISQSIANVAKASGDPCGTARRMTGQFNPPPQVFTSPGQVGGIVQPSGEPFGLIKEPIQNLLGSFLGAGTVAAGVAGMAGRFGTIAGIIRGASGKILRVVLGNGRIISRKKAVLLAKQIGLGAAATFLGISAVELAEMVLDETTTRRRRRGITARDLANAKRVNCKVANMAKTLGCKPTTRRRAPTCR